MALVRARGGGAAVFHGPIKHVTTRALKGHGTGLLDDVLLYQHAELGIGIIGLYRIVRVHKLYVRSMNNECLYGLLHLLTELGGAAIVQAAAVALHALATIAAQRFVLILHRSFVKLALKASVKWVSSAGSTLSGLQLPMPSSHHGHSLRPATSPSSRLTCQ